MKKTLLVCGGIVTVALAAAVGCGASGANDNQPLFTGGAGGAGGAGGTASAGGAGTGAIGGGGSGGLNLGGMSGGGNPGGGGSGGSSCASGPDEDKDQDGFSKTAGDCNDCDPNVNPGAIDVLHTEDGGNTWGDEDCDGTPGTTQATCDDGIALEDLDAMNAARAIELCQQASPADKKWGVLEAKWVRADGAPANPGAAVGIQPNFGPNVNVQGGTRMVAISSGYSRIPGQTGACGANTCSTLGAGVPPPGFPQDNPSCAGSTNINDDVALEVKLRAPKNATGYSFYFRFYSFEYPEWVCTSFNDQFIALVAPPPTGSINGNISFDSMANPVSVNIGFFEVCSGCPAGVGELAGTGFDGSWGDDAGATVWLQSQAPVTGGEEFTIRFAIWDTGDSAWDSTALLDNFKWIASGGTVDVGTTPVPTPR